MNAILQILFGYLTLRNLLLYTGLPVATWLFYKASIEPFISPISKIPGLPYRNPLLGNFLYLLSGEAMETSIEMIKNYGPLVRYYFLFGRERVLVADPDIMKHMLLTNSRNYVKPSHRIKPLRALLGDGLVTSEGLLHDVHKRLMKPAFNIRPITKMVPLFERCGNKLVDYWAKSLDENGTAVLPVGDVLSRVTLDIIGKAAFGYEFNSLTCLDHKVTAAFHSIMSGSKLSWRIALPFVISRAFSETRRFLQNVRLVSEVVDEIIKKKRQQLEQDEDTETVTSDVLGMMMAARDQEIGDGMSDEELRDQVMTVMLAGHETTATSMSWCLLMLATHPEVQQRARDEVMSVLGSSQPLTYDNLEQLEYCNCVVKETLRYLPPVPLTLRQANDSDVLPGNWYIPAGTIFLLALGPMMRRDELFPDASSFKPERFLHPETDTKDSNLYHFIPFLYGPRQCLGYRFAEVEMRALLAVLLRQFQFSVDPEGPAVYRRSLTITMRPDPPLRLRISALK